MRSLLVLVFVVSFSLSHATPGDSLGAPQKIKIKILPNGYYRPETRIAVGTFALLTFKPFKGDVQARWSYLKNTFMVTQNKQLALESDWLIFFKGEKLSFYGSLDVMKFPENFYGIGNNTVKDSVRNYQLNRISLNSLLLRNINAYYFAGINLDVQWLYGRGAVRGLEKFPLYTNVTGAGGYLASGIGPTFLQDSRDNGLIAHKGWYNEVSVNFHGKATLSEYTFTTIILNSRKFIPVFRKCTWASEVYMNFNAGAVPFRSNPPIGGFRFLRGYYTGRFRDKNLLLCQTEIRIPLFWRIGMVAFTGIGQVAPDLKSFSMDEIKLTGGGGLRFMLSEKQNANIRIDYGFTEEGGGLYMVFGEAF